QDVRAQFHQAHVRHILISTKKHTDVQAQALASHLIDKLKGGADFASLALQYSEDPSVKTNKGDDGWINQMTSYVPEFKKAALSLSKGEITPTPVKSDQYGYFIIQCLDVKENLPKDFDKNKQQYSASAAQQQVNEQMQAALASAMASAKITVLDPQLRADRELSAAQSADSSDPAKRNADLTAAIADYQAALPKARYSTQGEIHAGLAYAYLMQNNKDKEITELAAAVQTSGEPQMNLELGMLYKQKGDTKDALDQFALASQAAYDNQGIHMELEGIYKQMKQPELAAKETTWLADYNKRQKQAMASPQGTSNVTLEPGGKIKITPPAKK
ncbi:MAG TPA: peptidylprolyl isomerase, partial [Capsulimonadaceae bacterium]|nr:peptidylprolyl isomerase [Capsulimonadaceae bacterium]